MKDVDIDVMEDVTLEDLAYLVDEAETLESIAEDLNPRIGYFDPLELGSADFWKQGNAATVGFLRHSEIKHGRVAMAAFIGYAVQSNGIVWPWKLTTDISFQDISKAGSPLAQWDLLPTAAKIQILGFIGLLEFWSELSVAFEKDGGKHYMRGGVPGKYPSFDVLPQPHPLSLYDPLQLNKGKPRERLDKGLLDEINTGRLAMFAVMGFISESTEPGSVPLLADLAAVIPVLRGLIIPYDGQPMAPFSETDTSLPFVEQMIENSPVIPFPL